MNGEVFIVSTNGSTDVGGVVAEATALPDGSLKLTRVRKYDNKKER